MNDLNKKDKFINTICDQIKWEKSHNLISEEYEDHIIDAKLDYMDKGFSEDEALNRSIEDMGDPVEIGMSFNSIYKPSMNYEILFLTIFSFLLGLFIQVFHRQDLFTISWFNLNRTILTLILGILALIIGYSIDFTLIGRFSNIIIVSVIFMPYLLFFNEYLDNNFNKFIFFLYSHPFFLLTPLALASAIFSFRNDRYNIYKINLLFIITIIPYILSYEYIMASIIIFIYFTLIFFGINRGYIKGEKKKLYTIMILLLIGILLFISQIIVNNEDLLYSFKYMINPKTSPYYDKLISGQISSLFKEVPMIGSTDYIVPEYGQYFMRFDTDYIITFLILEYGWISLILIGGFFIFTSYKLLSISLKHKGILASLLSLSISLTFILQIIIYISINLGLNLQNRVILPLVSTSPFGNIISMLLIGIFLSINNLDFLYRNYDLKTKSI